MREARRVKNQKRRRGERAEWANEDGTDGLSQAKPILLHYLPDRKNACIEQAVMNAY